MFKIWFDAPLVVAGGLDSVADRVLFDRAETRSKSDPFAGLEDAHAAIVGDRFPGSAALFEKTHRLVVVGRRGSGFDNIDLNAATSRGICVTATPGMHTSTVAEFTMAMIVMLLRRAYEATRQLERGTWEPQRLLGQDVAGATLGVVGVGRIGRRVGELADAFGMQVVGFDPYMPQHAPSATTGSVRMTNLDALLATSDVVSIHVPRTATTVGLISARELALMRQGACLVNTARGGIVDEAALLSALQRGHLSGAALDVWDPEPPSVHNRLLVMDNVIPTPHVAARTVQSSERSQKQVLKNVLDVLEGRIPEFLANPDVWSRRRTAMVKRGPTPRPARPS